MTLAAQIVSDATDVFLNTEDFAETVTHHSYDGTDTEIVAIDFKDTEQDDPFANRDDLRESGAAIRNDQGIRIRRQAILEILATVTVDDRDYFTVGGEQWQVVRIANGRDAGLQSVMVCKGIPITTRRPRVRDR